MVLCCCWERAPACQRLDELRLELSYLARCASTLVSCPACPKTPGSTTAPWSPAWPQARAACTSPTLLCTCRPPPPSRRVYDGTWRGPNGNFAYFFHMLHLAGCEYPMSEHRQWLGVTQMPKGSGVEAVRTRPPLKRRLLMGMGAAQVRWPPPLGVGWGRQWLCVPALQVAGGASRGRGCGHAHRLAHAPLGGVVPV